MHLIVNIIGKHFGIICFLVKLMVNLKSNETLDSITYGKIPPTEYKNFC